MADDEHQVTRDVAYFDDQGTQASAMVDPLIVFYWARLDELESQAVGSDPRTHTAPFRRMLDDVAAKKAILDDYARQCADTTNPAREMICGVQRTVIRRLAAAYADHPDFQPEWRL